MDPATLSWTDSLVLPWNINLTNGSNEVVLSTPEAEDLVMVLKLRFATADHYLLGIEFPKTSSTAPIAEAEATCERTLGELVGDGLVAGPDLSARLRLLLRKRLWRSPLRTTSPRRYQRTCAESIQC